jgi:hypothetical protein
MTEKKKKQKRELACFRPGKYQGISEGRLRTSFANEFEIVITDDFSILRINGQDYFFRADNGSFDGAKSRDRAIDKKLGPKDGIRDDGQK